MISDLPTVSARIVDVRQMCEMFRFVSRDSVKVAAVIECSEKNVGLKNNKFSRLGKEINYRYRKKEYAVLEYQLDGRSVREVLPVGAVSGGKVVKNQAYPLHYSAELRRVIGRSYTILNYWPKPLLGTLMFVFFLWGYVIFCKAIKKLEAQTGDS